MSVTSSPVSANEMQSGWLEVAQVRDVDELAAAQTGWALEYVQLSRGSFDAEMNRVHLPGVRLFRELTSQSVRQRGQIGTRQMGFAMCRAPSGNAFFHGQSADAECIMVGRGDELDLTQPADAQLLAAVVDEDLLSELWLQLYAKPWSHWLDQKIVIRSTKPKMEILYEAHRRAVDAVRARPEQLSVPQSCLQLRDAVLLEWLWAIPAVVDTSGVETPNARRKLVERACNLVLGSPSSPVTMLEVCRRIGASPRHLEVCFRSILGITPQKYLRAVRLAAARRELKTLAGSGVSVHDVAARWGFWHMSAFSSEYKQQFGESPSATVRSQVARAAQP